MTDSSFFNTVYVAAQWLVKIAYLQLLWIVFSVVGLGVFGIFPATAAMLAVIRQWIFKKNTDGRVGSIYFHYFKNFFLPCNGLGYSLALLTFCLSFYIYFFNQMDAIWGKLGLYLFLMLFVFIVIMCIYIFPVFVHYKVKFLQAFKSALLIGLLRPLHTLSFFFLMIIFYIWGNAIPGFIPVISVSLLGIGWMSISLNAFKKIDQKGMANVKHMPANHVEYSKSV